MTRKHFNAIAAAIAALPDPRERKRIATVLIPICRDNNPAFRKDLFLDACKVAA
jgi:hypothetical protein